MGLIRFPNPERALDGLERGMASPEHWKHFDRARAAFEPRWRMWFTKIARDEWREDVLPVVLEASVPGVAIVYIEQSVSRNADKRWREPLELLYADVGRVFAEKQMRLLLDHKKDVFGELGASEETWMRVVRDWLRTQAGVKIRQITLTTLFEVRRVLNESVRLGEGIDKARRRLELAMPGITANRATTIARTEIISASNLGARAGAAQTGLRLNHEWIATPGPRTRPTHASASGQTKPQEQPFDVGGERLLFPGDGSQGASAGNLVNCRCTVAFIESSDDNTVPVNWPV